MHRLVHFRRQQRRVPGRRAGLAYSLVWHAGTVRLWHGLHRLWTALLSSAIAATPTTAAVATAVTFSAAVTTVAFASSLFATVATASLTVTAPAAPGSTALTAESVAPATSSATPAAV